MKTDIEIKDDMYLIIKDSELANNVTGVLSKRKRPDGSCDEDIVISVLANNNAQLQEAYVNVNIYVRDKDIDGQYEEDSQRLRELCKMSERLLLRGYKDDFMFVLDSQRVLPVNEKNEHMINNKILYKQVND